ncbi:MAG: YbaB/EbfC family nucleoid-associated protein [Saprospiraceae bacterium]
MFGDMMGNMDAKKKEMAEKLSAMIVEESAGAIKIEANANREILNISIDKSKLDSDDMEELEDLLLIAINRVLAKAAEKEAAEAQNMINDMLPPGLGNLFGGS